MKLDSPASDHVFQLPELLEQILAHLPSRDLLLAQRVSRSFRRTINDSPRLQRLLFFRPDWRFHDRFAGEIPDSTSRPSNRKPDNNRLLLRAFPGCYPTVTLVLATGDAAFPLEGNQSVLRRSEQWSWDVCISFPADRAPNCNAAVNYPEASWRRMYLSQPPCQKLYLVRRWARSISPAIVCDQGITMGAFYDEAMQSHKNSGPDAESTTVSNGWHRAYIASDRDWHFEGRIKPSLVEV